MFSPTYQLLEQESLVARSCLCTGLTDIRNANLRDKGRYYTAFFQLAIGIERIAKLALILDHMAQNNLQPPGRQAVRAYGHDLQTLFTTVQTNALIRGYMIASSFTLSPLASTILAFLSDFAKDMRYANLDALASGSVQRKPLYEWDQILQNVIAIKIKTKTKHRVIGQSIAVAKAIQDITFVAVKDMAGKSMSLTSVISQPALLDKASKYVVWEVLSLLAPIRDFIVSAGQAAQQIDAGRNEDIPYMSEFFEFIWLDRNYVFRKKHWP